MSEAERNKISERWANLSRKSKTDREVRNSIKTLENEVSIRGTEADEYRDKFA